MGLQESKRFHISINSKMIIIMILDVVFTAAAYFFGLWLRADFAFENISPVHMAGFLSAIGPWCAITVLVFMCFRLYSSIWAFVSVPEVMRIAGAYGVLAVIGVAMFHFDGVLMPRSSMVVGFLMSYLFSVCILFAYRLWLSALRKLSHAAHASGMKNVMLIGAGDAGRALAQEFINSDYIKDRLACVIDDNPVKQGKD